MTEKRFWYDFEDCKGAKIIDFKKDTEYALETIGDFRKIEDLLNELNDENECLKYKVNDLLYQIEYVGKNNKSCDECECFIEDIGYCWMWDMNVKKEDIVVACDKREVKSEKKRIGENGDVE